MATEIVVNVIHILKCIQYVVTNVL